jgi:hypothetical protein
MDYDLRLDPPEYLANRGRVAQVAENLPHCGLSRQLSPFWPLAPKRKELVFSPSQGYQQLAADKPTGASDQDSHCACSK